MPTEARDAEPKPPFYGALPRGMSRPEAAWYVGVGATTFDAMVTDGRMPRPKQINTRKVWDRHALDVAFAALPDDGHEPDDEWSKVAP